MADLEMRRKSSAIYVIDNPGAETFFDVSRILTGYEDYNIIDVENINVFMLGIDAMLPSCVILEADAVQLSKLALARSQSIAGPPLSLILIGGKIEVATVIEALKVASLHFLERPFDASHLLAALAAGFAGLDRQMDALASDHVSADKLASLTPRERNVFEGLIEGLSNKEIAKRLFISHRTVEVYRANLAVKLASKKPTDWVRLKLSLPPDPAARLVEDDPV